MRLAKSAALIAFLGFAGGNPSAKAHQTLYHNVEIYLHDPAIIRVLVTVHAPELPSGVAAGIDPSAVEDDWLPTRPDAELAALFEEADRFVRETFSFAVVEHGDAPIKPIDRDSLPLEFETPEQIRDPDHDNGLPAGCFLVTFEFQNPGAPKSLALSFSPTAEKRLLLAVSRPGEFPEVRDLEAAESVQIELHEAPPPKTNWLSVLVALVTVGTAVAALAWLAFRLRSTR